MMFTCNTFILGPEGLEISREDLDIISHNPNVGVGDQMADLIEKITNEIGPDDGEDLGINKISDA